jgi:hypothetical protein
VSLSDPESPWMPLGPWGSDFKSAGPRNQFGVNSLHFGRGSRLANSARLCKYALQQEELLTGKVAPHGYKYLAGPANNPRLCKRILELIRVSSETPLKPGLLHWFRRVEKRAHGNNVPLSRKGTRKGQDQSANQPPSHSRQGRST